MTLARLMVVAAALVSGCGFATPPYDWTPVKHSLARALPAGTSATRVAAVLDSLGFTRGRPTGVDSIMYASKREPSNSNIVFGTLQLVATFDAHDRLTTITNRVVYTGP